MIINDSPNPAKYAVLTYLSGTLQEDGSSKMQQYKEGGLTTAGFTTTKPFDAVEVKLTPANNGSEETTPVLEFCSDTQMRPD